MPRRIGSNVCDAPGFGKPLQHADAVRVALALNREHDVSDDRRPKRVCQLLQEGCLVV
jgi:hypothetical protein